MSILPHYLHIVDKQIACPGSLPGMDERGAGCRRRVEHEPVHSDRQKRRMGNAGLYGMERGVAGTGVAEHQASG